MVQNRSANLHNMKTSQNSAVAHSGCFRSYLTDNDYFDKKTNSTRKCIIKLEIKSEDLYNKKNLHKNIIMLNHSKHLKPKHITYLLKKLIKLHWVLMIMKYDKTSRYHYFMSVAKRKTELNRYFSQKYKLIIKKLVIQTKTQMKTIQIGVKFQFIHTE